MDKTIEGYSSYSISPEGKVFSKISHRYLKPFVNKVTCGGFPQVTLCRGDHSPKAKRDWFKIHTLVATAFVPNPHKYIDIMHLDGDIHNNNSYNLEWVSRLDSDYAISNL